MSTKEEKREKREQEKVSVDQYGRKTWDVKAYAKNANKPKSKPEPKEHEEITNRSTSHMAHRQKLLDSLINAIKRHTLINPQSSQKNGRFGFVCPVCDYTYRDNMALIDHFNSPQHIQRVTGKALSGAQDDEEEEEEGDVLEGGIRHASVEEVDTTLQLLLNQHNEESQKTIQQRIEARKQFEQRLQQRKQKKRQKKQKPSDLNDSNDNENDEMAQMMGFSSFKS